MLRLFHAFHTSFPRFYVFTRRLSRSLPCPGSFRFALRLRRSGRCDGLKSSYRRGLCRTFSSIDPCPILLRRVDLSGRVTILKGSRQTRPKIVLRNLRDEILAQRSIPTTVNQHQFATPEYPRAYLMTTAAGNLTSGQSEAKNPASWLPAVSRKMTDLASSDRANC